MKDRSFQLYTGAKGAHLFDRALRVLVLTQSFHRLLPAFHQASFSYAIGLREENILRNVEHRLTKFIEYYEV